MITIRCLTIRQPWAHAIMHWSKDVENRSRPTDYRGRLYIHVADEWDRDVLAGPHMLNVQELNRELGCIIGHVNVVDCVGCGWGSPWFCGPFGWVLRDPTPLITPIAMPVKPGIWEAELKEVPT